MMEGRKRIVHHHNHNEMGDIKKGPWKAEEDEVLINHVKKYGPRDWSSIRSKGLLQRTGKSCRLRWVNKLRPNLKNGVKFSAEEERTVIDLQAQFGNKWAKIATYLHGRTDNDVKNFWSSRQKRLKRILQSSTPSSSKSHKNSKEAPKLSSSTEEESSNIDDSETMIKMMPNLLSYEESPLQLDESKSSFSFPEIPQLQLDFPLESQDIITRIGDPSFDDVFANSSDFGPSFFAHETSCQIGGKVESLDAVTLDSFIDDFPPIETFDHIEPLPSPSEWS